MTIFMSVFPGAVMDTRDDQHNPCIPMQFSLQDEIPDPEGLSGGISGFVVKYRFIWMGNRWLMWIACGCFLTTPGTQWWLVQAVNEGKNWGRNSKEEDNVMCWLFVYFSILTTWPLRWSSIVSLLRRLASEACWQPQALLLVENSYSAKFHAFSPLQRNFRPSKFFVQLKLPKKLTEIK